MGKNNGVRTVGKDWSARMIGEEWSNEYNLQGNTTKHEQRVDKGARTRGQEQGGKNRSNT